MAEFLITAPDGKKYKVTGATREGALVALKKKLGTAPATPAGDTSMGTAFAVADKQAEAAGNLGSAAITRRVNQGPLGQAQEFMFDKVGNPIREFFGMDPVDIAAVNQASSDEATAKAAQAQQSANQFAQDSNFENLTLDSVNDLGSFFRYVGQKGAQAAPYMAVSMASGGTATYPFSVGEISGALEEIEGKTQEEKDKIATRGGAIMTALENLGIASLLPAGVSNNIIGGIASGAISEGFTEGVQELVVIGSEAVAGKQFTEEELVSRLKEATAAGAVVGGSFKAGGQTVNATSKIFSSDGSVNNPDNMSAEGAAAAGAFARRLREIAQANEYDLKDVNANSTKGARETVDKAHIQLAEELKKVFKDLGELVTPDKLKTFIETKDQILAQAAYREARNKTKSTVGQQELDAMRRLVGDTAEGQQAINLMLQLNQLTEVHNAGYKGGLSRITDVFNPLDQNINSYDTASRVVTGTLSPLATAAGAVSTGGASLAPQAALFGTGRAVDAMTGRRSTVDRFVRRNEGNSPDLPAPTAPSLVETKRLQEQQAQDETQRNQEQQKQLNLQLAQQDAPATPGSPQFTMEDATGLSRDGVARILRVLKGRNDNPALIRAIQEYEQSVATGGRIEDLSPLIRAVRQFQQDNPEYVPMVRPPNSLSNPMLADPAAPGQPPAVSTTEANPVQAQTFGPQFTTQENYNRGIEANKAMNAELVEGVTTDPELNRVQKGRLITSLDVLANNLGSDPVAAAQEQVQKLEEAGVPQEAIDAYVKPYVDRVVSQQAARVSPDEPILGSINPDIPAPTTVQTAALSAPTPVVHQQIKAPEGQTNHGLLPHLRVEAPTAREGKPLVLAGTNNKNASRQIDGIDEVLARHEDPAGSSEAWASMLGDAMATKDVPVQPHGFIEDLNNGGAQELLSTLTPGQIADADHGFRNAAEFRQAYTNGEIGIEDTGRLFLWSFLSRGVSPYTQEGLFMDSFNGIEEWIRMAAGKSNRGSLADNIKDYEKWAKSAAPKGSGQPGAGATHNLNAFGNTFLMKMSQDAGKGDGRSRLQVIHDMMSDPNTTGKEVRREFLRMGEGVGIDNKVVSFTLLVAGYDDVMVLDRVQMRQMWNDGRFSGINLYDGYKSDGKPVTGSALSSLTYGARGLLVYEAMEKSLQNRLSQIYSDVGRPDAASVGRYHWETWVASSQQEASHGTIDAILKRAKGDPNPLEGVTAKEGEYGAYAYGARYGVENGVPMFTYEVPGHGEFKFTVPDFQKFLEDIKKPKNKVVPTKFKVTESGNAPWYTREGVNLDALAEKAKEHGKQIRTADAELQQGPTVPDGRTLDAPSGEPILGSRSPIEPILRDTSPGANPDGPRSDVIPTEKPQVTPEQYKKAVVELIRPQFQIGLKGGELEDGISNFNDAVEFARKLGVVVRLAMSQNELNTLLQLDTGQDPSKMGTFRGMFQRKGPKKQGKGIEGTIWAMKPGADKGDGTYVTDIEALTTLLHEISHAITLGPLDGKGDQEIYSYFINRKQSSKPGTGIVGRSDFTAPGSFTDSAIKPLLDADWEQMSPTQKKAYAEIVDLQENVEAYSPKNPNERRAVRFIRQVMTNPGYSQETKQAYQDYTRMAAEFAVDPVWVYLINPKLAKKLMPTTSKMIQQEFRKADNKVIQFYAHPLAVVMAALVALEMAMDDEEERRQQQMPPGALNAPMAPGMLSQA